MVFGFNTDVQYENATYHVQTEARQQAHVLETQVFFQGRSVGKRVTSYANRLGQTEFNENQLHEMLKEQHKAVLEVVRQGHLDQISEPTTQSAASSTHS